MKIDRRVVECLIFKLGILDKHEPEDVPVARKKLESSSSEGIAGALVGSSSII